MTKAKRRHGYIDEGPTPAEVRATDPTPRPQRRKKNTRRWCRGKEGVEHVLETRLDKYAVYRRERDPHALICYRAEWWPRRWWCSHERACVNCGKILVISLEDDCPDFTTDVTYHRRKKTDDKE